MTILKVHFATGQPFLEHYLGDLPNGGLFFPTRRALAIGLINQIVDPDRLPSRVALQSRSTDSAWMPKWPAQGGA